MIHRFLFLLLAASLLLPARQDLAAAPGDVLWSVDLGSRIQSSPTVGPDGTIYVGTDEGKLLAVEPKGTIKWSFRTAGPVPGSAILTEDSHIVFGSTDKILYGLRPDGKMRWLATPGSGVVSTPAPGNDGNIFVTTVFNKLTCFNEGGRREWEFEADGNLVSSPALGKEGVVYFGSQNKTLYAVNADGSGRWTFKAGDKINSSPALDAQGRIYFGCLDSRLYSVTPEGDKYWEYLSGGPVRSSPVVGEDGTLFVGSDDGKLHAITPDGYKKWTFPTGAWIRSSPVVGKDGETYISSYDKSVYCIDANGKKKWSVGTGAEISSSPALASGTLYIGSWDNKLYAIETGSELAKSSWPMFRGNAAHTGNKDLKRLAPVLKVTNLDEGQPLIEPATFRVLTTIDNLPEPPERVELYLGAIKVGDYTEAPYLYVQQKGPYGTYMFSAMAYLKNGARLLSDPTYVEVIPEPDVAMVRPMKPKPFVTTTESPVIPEKKNPYDDITPPQLLVTSHEFGGRYTVTDATIEIKGTAKDDFQMGWLEYLVGTGKPTTVEVPKDWTFEIELKQGINVLKMQAADRAGNRTEIQSITFELVTTARPEITMEGEGAFSPDYGKQSLEIGKTYPITAFPKPGYEFVEWSGERHTDLETIRFTMKADLKLHAVFKKLPPIDWEGSFAGLAQNPEQPGLTPAFVGVDVDGKGRYTAQLKNAHGTSTIKGQFQRRIPQELEFEHPEGVPNLLVMEYDPENSRNVISGAWRSKEGTLEIMAERISSKTTREQLAGNYTFTLADRAQSGAPGYGSFSISSKGDLKSTLHLGDGSKITTADILTSQNGLWTIHATTEEGVLFGWARFKSDEISDCFGTLQFHPHSMTQAPKNYSLLGSKFNRPSRSQPLFTTNQHLLAVHGEDLPNPIALPVELDSRNRLSIPNVGRDWRVKIDSNSGLFEGEFPHPLSGEQIEFNGALLQKAATGTGTFKVGEKTGTVVIASPLQ